MTHEQLRICNHNVTSGQIAKIIAFAGRFDREKSVLLVVVPYNIEES